MEFIKRIAGVSTPPAPKFKPLDLPTLGEGGVPTPPPLIEGWASSYSSGSSVSSSTPTTPSTSPTPWRRQHTPYSSPLASYRVPSVRSPTPQTEMRSEAWHVMTSQMEKTISRQTLTPSPEILKPRPRRASPLHEPSPVQVMQGLVSPSPRPIHGKPIKSILKHSMPRSTASTPAPRVPYRTSEVRLHWQLCPYNTYSAGRKLRIDFDVTKPVDLIDIRDLSRAAYPRRLSRGEVDNYLQRKVCEDPPLRQMTIHYEGFPQWTLVVNRDDGGELLVRDVFNAMYEDLRKIVNRMQRQAWIPVGRIQEYSDAFVQRCAEDPTNVAERKAGMRRVDLLLGNSTFLGLTRPQKDDDDYWIAHFGARPSH